MSTAAEELHRLISTSLRDMLDAFRIQAQAGPMTDTARLWIQALKEALRGDLPRCGDHRDYEHDEENEIEQTVLDLAAEHMWQIVSLTVLKP